jgi:hypothetical protein
LAERVAGSLSVGAKLCVDGNELGAGVHDLDALDLRFHHEHSRLAPAAAYRAIPELSSRLEGVEASRPVMSGA